MNHTGTRAAGRPRHARRNGASAVGVGGVVLMRSTVPKVWSDDRMRRSIDDYPFSDDDLAPAEDVQRLSWAVAVSDDYDDAEPRVVLTVEEVGRAGTGLIAHLPPAIARRLRVALRDALREIGEEPGS
jgi:hypothetical protein